MADTLPTRTVFVTGKLAETALRKMLSDLAPRIGGQAEVVVLPITVAALMTTRWVASHLPHLGDGIDRIILPGYCRGDVADVEQQAGVPVQLGPKELRDLPGFLGQKASALAGYGAWDIAILAEINHAPTLGLPAILERARAYRQGGADIIDVGCDPGATWTGVGDAVQALVGEGFQVSIDSWNPEEVRAAVQAGARLVLSVNRTNVQHARDWKMLNEQVEVVAIPDTPTDLDSLHETVQTLEELGVPYRLDPILEPIGFGFAASLGRYIATRQRFPQAEMLMGIGNLTELTDTDSAAINVLLAGFCQELGIRSVLTTEVIPWCQSAVQEFARARQLVHYAVRERVLPKRLDPGLVMLRDITRYELGQEALEELARRVTDPNYRIFAERGELHILNGQMYLRGTDPFLLFQEMMQKDPRLDLPHAFYLGYELAKAVTALTLGKNYTQDQALDWGFLTVPEVSHRDR